MWRKLLKSKRISFVAIVVVALFGAVFLAGQKDTNVSQSETKVSVESQEVKGSDIKLKVVESSGRPTSVIDYLQGAKQIQAQSDNNYQNSQDAQNLQPNAGKDSLPASY